MGNSVQTEAQEKNTKNQEKTEASPAYFSVVTEFPEKKSARKWIVISLVTLLWHLMMLYMKPDLLPKFRPAPVAIQDIDPAKIEAIKNQWKKKQSLLLSKDKSPVDKNTPAPKGAEYISDRNRTVEKEQRAARTNVVPNQGGNPNANNAKPKPKKEPLPALSNLGVPIPNAPKKEDLDPGKRGQGETGDQALLDQELPIGAENLLNTQESVYYSFYARIYEAIGPLWQSKIRSLAEVSNIPPGEYVNRVEVVLDRDGNFVETRMLRSSGVMPFDHAVEDSWRRIPRFPNPPRDLLDSNGLLRMAWTFSVLVDRRTGFQYIPPEREY